MIEYEAHLKEHDFKKQSQLKRAQMSISLCEQKDCEKRVAGMFHKNKAKQSQSFDPSAALSASSLSLRTSFAEK